MIKVITMPSTLSRADSNYRKAAKTKVVFKSISNHATIDTSLQKTFIYFCLIYNSKNSLFKNPDIYNQQYQF